MNKIRAARLSTAAFASLLLAANAISSNADNRPQLQSVELQSVVDDTIHTVMSQHDIPGMAVAVTFRGERYYFNYGVISKETGRKVTENTIFEIGSVSKVFTSTLASYARVRGKLSFSDSASKHLPDLAGSSFDRINVLELGTYTAGGLPLQFPDSVRDTRSMISYYKGWQPSYAAGTRRLYSNTSIGLFGYLAANSIGEPFDALMEETLFPAFGLKHTYLRVPQDRMNEYAWGYSKDGMPIRVSPGVLDSEAYGVKTTASDMVRFLEANIDGIALDKDFGRAVAETQLGYFEVGDMRQGLGWEMYAYPTALERLLDGNSTRMIYDATPVKRLDPPKSPQLNTLYNKTGSTNGFGAYVIFVPAKRIGIVMLANKNYPNPVRIKAAYKILTQLDQELQSAGRNQ